MIKGIAPALRFARGWKGHAGEIRELELMVERNDRAVPATLFLPSGASTPLPAWVILHGLTRPGRHHPTLLRFVRALAGSGAAVLVPEIPEWRELYLAPDEARETLRASVLLLDEREETARGRIGAVGFSFGVPQVLIAAADPSLRGHLQAAAGFGGYADLNRTFRFLFSGEHEWGGRTYRGHPDPYGRWVVGGNFLARVPGFEDATDVAEALLALARIAGDLQVASWTNRFDSVKEELARTVHPARRGLFTAIAPPGADLPPRDLAEELAPALARTTREASPHSEAGPFLGQVAVPTRLIHGREDRLIPFTESLRLREAFPPTADIRLHITGLFAHSQRNRTVKAAGEIREQLQFLWTLMDLLALP